jgi:hypothetical protein
VIPPREASVHDPAHIGGSGVERLGLRASTCGSTLALDAGIKIKPIARAMGL